MKLTLNAIKELNMNTFITKFIACLALLWVMIPMAYAGSSDKLYISDGYRQVQLFSTGDNGPTYLGEIVKKSEQPCQGFFEYYDNFVGTLLPETPAPPPGCLFGPRGIILQNPGQLLVVSQSSGLDPFGGGVYRYNANTGKFLKTLVPVAFDPSPGPPSLYAPRGMVMSQDGKNVFVADYLSNTPDGEGQLLVYTKQGQFITSLVPPSGTVFSGLYHPRAVVIGPDGLLYVSNVADTNTGLGGQVFRFDPNTFEFVDVFIDDAGGVGHLNRPEGLVFGPDGKLYIVGYRASSTDFDSIRIYSSAGKFLDKIGLADPGNDKRAYAAAALFGPEGKLFVPIVMGVGAGQVRSYDVSDPSYPYDIYIPAGIMEGPGYLTFGKTNRATLAYEE
jgi:DNA-binding beta-propeller fold protein YncE